MEMPFKQNMLFLETYTIWPKINGHAYIYMFAFYLSRAVFQSLFQIREILMLQPTYFLLPLLLSESVSC